MTTPSSCPECGEPVDAGAAYCAACGVLLVETEGHLKAAGRICFSCGHEADRVFDECPECGHRPAADGEEPVAPPQKLKGRWNPYFAVGLPLVVAAVVVTLVYTSGHGGTFDDTIPSMILAAILIGLLPVAYRLINADTGPAHPRRRNSHGGLVVLWRTGNVAEAEAMEAMLRAEGIAAVVFNRHLGNMYPSLPEIRLMVPETDVERAEEILTEWRPAADSSKSS
ncbi:MAG: DUF2007 domain-containing protein [Deltaproteobacteria bacterium]|nr:DUF2007 domain-containing protein [Deltaproteobacteria bacterium]